MKTRFLTVGESHKENSVGGEVATVMVVVFGIVSKRVMLF